MYFVTVYFYSVSIHKVVMFLFSGQNQCLVQLSTLPVAVCYGTGATVKEAQSAAAHNALEYLMIMTKK